MFSNRLGLFVQVLVTFFETFNRADIRHITATFSSSIKSCGRKLENPLDKATQLLKMFRVTYLVFSGNPLASFKIKWSATAHFGLFFRLYWLFVAAWYLSAASGGPIAVEFNSATQKHLLRPPCKVTARRGPSVSRSNSFRSRFWPSELSGISNFSLVPAPWGHRRFSAQNRQIRCAKVYNGPQIVFERLLSAQGVK